MAIMGKNKNANFSKPFNVWIFIFWNPFIYIFICPKIKKFTIGNFCLLMHVLVPCDAAMPFWLLEDQILPSMWRLWCSSCALSWKKSLYIFMRNGRGECDPLKVKGKRNNIMWNIEWLYEIEIKSMLHECEIEKEPAELLLGWARPVDGEAGGDSIRWFILGDKSINDNLRKSNVCIESASVKVPSISIVLNTVYKVHLSLGNILVWIYWIKE